MPWQYNPYAFPVAITAAISAALMFIAWQRRHVRAAKPFAFLALAVAEWTVGYTLELSSADLAMQLTWAKIEYLGIVAVPLAWFAFALVYSGHEQWLRPRNLLLFAAEPVITVLLVFTNDWHGLVWTHVTAQQVDSFSIMSPTYGAWFWVHTAYSYALVLGGTILIFQTIGRFPRMYSGQSAILVISVLAPWVGNALYLSRASPFPYLDLTPFAFTVSGIGLAWDLRRYQFLDILPVARHLLVESMRDAVFVLDVRNRIVDLNPAAQQLLGRSTSEVVGAPTGQVLAAWHDLVARCGDAPEAHDEVVLGEGVAQRWFDLRISPLRDQSGRLNGRLVVAREVTDQKRAEKARSAAYRISEAAHSVRNLDELFCSIHRIVGDLMPAGNLYIALYDPTDDVLTFPYWADEHDPRPAPSQPGKGLTAYVLRTGKPLLATPTVFAELAVSGQVEQMGSPSTYWLGVPLRTNGKPFGVLAVHTYTGGRVGEEEKETLVFVSEQVAMAIERVRAEEALRRARDELEVRVAERTADLAQANASLQAEISERLAVALEKARLFDELKLSLAMSTRLYELSSQILTASTVEETARLVTETLHESFGADATTIQLIDAKGNPEFNNSIGLSATFHQKAKMRPGGTTMTAWTSGRPVVVNDPAGLHPNLRAEGIQAGVALPLLGEPTNLGVVFLSYRQPHTFSEREVELLSLFANQAAFALKRVRLVEETRWRALEQSTLSEVARALNAELDVRQAFPAVVASLRQLTRCDHAGISLLDANNQEYTVAVLDAPRMEWKPGDRVAATASNATVDLLAGRAHLSRDLSAELDLPLEQALYLEGVRSRVVLPLMVGTTVLGGLELTSMHANTFDEAQVPLLQQIANAVAISVENSRLFEAEQTRRAELSALYDLSRALAAAPPDFDSILQLVARHAVETIHVTLARVLLTENGDLVVRAAHPRRLLGRELEIGHRAAASAYPSCQEVMEHNDPHVFRASDSGMSAQEHDALFLGLCQTICVVPLRADNRSLGFIVLGEERSEEREPFTLDKIRLAHSIGDQAASALQRAELFDELERAYLQTVLSLANAVEVKDSYTSDHVQNVAQMAIDIGRAMDLSQRELVSLRFGAILHDIGKLGIPDAILKKPGPLNAEEWEIMRQHPVIGERILAPIQRLRDAAQIVRHHHERYDGSGYPDGLAGEAIPLGARILTVVDSYSAIVDRRVYKEARSPQQAMAELNRCAGVQFDPQVIELFVRRAAQRSAIEQPATILSI